MLYGCLVYKHVCMNTQLHCLKLLLMRESHSRIYYSLLQSAVLLQLETLLELVGSNVLEGNMPFIFEEDNLSK